MVFVVFSVRLNTAVNVFHEFLRREEGHRSQTQEKCVADKANISEILGRLQ